MSVGTAALAPQTAGLYGLNPVTKIAMALALGLSGFLVTNYWVIFAVVVCLHIVGAVTKVLRRLFRTSSAILITLLVGALGIQGFFHPDNETILLSFWILDLGLEGLERGLLLFARICVLVVAFLLVTLTTHPRDLTIAFTNRGMSHKLAYAVGSAMQLIPEMKQRSQAIVEAQQARGFNVQSNIFARTRSLTTMFIPLCVGALISAQTRSLALEARGFGQPGRRVFLRQVDEETKDRVLQVLSLVLVLLVVGWRVFQWQR